MKHLLTLIAFLLVAGVQGGYTQKKNDGSDYNYKRAMEILDNDGNPDEALEWLNKQLQVNPKHGDALITRAMYFYSKEKYGAALTDMNNAIKYYNKKNEYKLSSIYTGRAMVYEDMGELEKAIADYTSAYDNTKNEDTSLSHITSILESRAHIYYTQKNYSAADNDYRLMLKHDEANQAAIVGLARNMIMREEHQKAVDMLNNCQRYGDDYDQIYRFRLQAYDKLGEIDKAIDDATYDEIYCKVRLEAGMFGFFYQNGLPYCVFSKEEWSGMTDVQRIVATRIAEQRYKARRLVKSFFMNYYGEITNFFEHYSVTDEGVTVSYNLTILKHDEVDTVFSLRTFVIDLQAPRFKYYSTMRERNPDPKNHRGLMERGAQPMYYGKWIDCNINDSFYDIATLVMHIKSILDPKLMSKSVKIQQTIREANADDYCDNW